MPEGSDIVVPKFPVTHSYKHTHTHATHVQDSSTAVENKCVNNCR